MNKKIKSPFINRTMSSTCYRSFFRDNDGTDEILFAQELVYANAGVFSRFRNEAMLCLRGDSHAYESLCAILAAILPAILAQMGKIPSSSMIDHVINAMEIGRAHV